MLPVIKGDINFVKRFLKSEDKCAIYNFTNSKILFNDFIENKDDIYFIKIYEDKKTKEIAVTELSSKEFRINFYDNYSEFEKQNDILSKYIEINKILPQKLMEDRYAD